MRGEHFGTLDIHFEWNVLVQIEKMDMNKRTIVIISKYMLICLIWRWLTATIIQVASIDNVQV